MILNALEGKPLPVYGDGMNIRDWLYVEDHCRALALTARQGRVGETYNIGGECEMRNIDLVKTLCAKLDKYRPRSNGRSYSELITFVKDRPGHDRRYAIDQRKIANELGFAPAESFESGMDKTIQWYLENSQWCADIARKGYQRDRLATK